ncbi:diguanylate cyclase [Deinococcus malanensis]|nr:diguanylate cyclase [Deinococcus malanensis]
MPQIVSLANDLLLNFSVLIAGLFAISLTFRQPDWPESWRRILTRYLTSVTTAFLLMINTVSVASGLSFDFRSVLVALAAQRNGVLAGLLIALPIGVYRLYVRGPAAFPGVLNLVLVALLAGKATGLFRLMPRWEHSIQTTCQQAVLTFLTANLTVFVAFWLVGRPPADALPVYVVFSSISVLGMVVGEYVTYTRLAALARAQSLEQLAYVDPLTGAFNRRMFDESLREFPPGSFLLLLDLDRFKRINDTYGHVVGDQVLICLVQMLQAEIRSVDRVYRLGGEEFGVLLAPGSAEQVRMRVERLRAEVEQSLATKTGLTEETITVSGGLVLIVEEPRTALANADRLLYSAKAAGRNMILSNLR